MSNYRYCFIFIDVTRSRMYTHFTLFPLSPPALDVIFANLISCNLNYISLFVNQNIFINMFIRLINSFPMIYLFILLLFSFSFLPIVKKCMCIYPSSVISITNVSPRNIHCYSSLIVSFVLQVCLV